VKGDAIPPEHHVMRVCKQRGLQWGPDGEPTGVSPDEFTPDVDGLSVTWLEFFSGSLSEQFAQARATISRSRHIRASHRLAGLSVGKIVAIHAKSGNPLVVEHDPDETPGKENPAHSLITGYGEDDEDAKNLLRTTVVFIKP